MELYIYELWFNKYGDEFFTGDWFYFAESAELALEEMDAEIRSEYFIKKVKKRA